jgi:hypothetical protein
MSVCGLVCLSCIYSPKGKMKVWKIRVLDRDIFDCLYFVVCAFAVKGEWLASNNQTNKFSGTVNDGDVKTVFVAHNNIRNELTNRT